MSTIIQNMGRRGLVCAVGVAVLAALAMPAAAAGKKTKAAPAEKAERPVQVLQIELYQNLPPSRAKALNGLVERFNAQSKAYQVTLVDSDWRAPKAPHLLILGGEDEEAFLVGKPRYKALAVLMKEAGVALQAVKPPAMVTRKPVGANGRLLALPVGLNTPVLYFNRAALKPAGIDAGTARFSTWSALQGELSKLVANGSTCPLAVVEPARVLIENESAWNNVPVLKGKQPVFNGLFHVKYIAQLATWYRANLLKVFKDRTDAEQRFAKGECALLIGPSDSWVDFRSSGLDVGVARLPYVEGAPGAPQNTLADGASLWVTAGKKAAEYKGVASFVSFWLQPDNQVAWQRETGYLPLSRAGILAASESTLLADDLENIKVAIGQLTNRPVSPSSAAQPAIERASARRVIDEELDDLWADRKSAKAALEAAASRLSSGK